MADRRAEDCPPYQCAYFVWQGASQLALSEVERVRAASDVRFTFMDSGRIYNYADQQSFAADQSRFLGPA